MRMAYIGLFLTMTGAAQVWLFGGEDEYGGAFSSRDGCPADKPAGGNREGQGC